MTLSITTLQNGIVLLRSVSLMLCHFMLNVTSKLCMLTVVMLNVVILSIFLLNVVAPLGTFVIVHECIRVCSLHGHGARKVLYLIFNYLTK